MTVSSIGGTATGQTNGTSGISASSGTDPAEFARILDAFKKEAAKTPAERARDEVLKKHQLSEDSYKALPPEQKKAIDAEIAVAAQRAMQADKGKGFKGAESAAAVAQDISSFA